MKKDIQTDTFDWSADTISRFRQTVLTWYDATKRDLPWRQTKDPYKIWVSEIMLQQTQVATVIPYYLRFIDTLPTIEALAQVDEQTLLNLWQGLGYYSRVRNMQTAAQQIIERHNGVMPNTMADLLRLKGIGPYTAAAIGSISFNLVEPAIDGNLLRVTARLFEIEADIAQPKSRKIFDTILRRLIDPQRPGDFNQALMDIGATIMTPANLTPELNPLKEFDQSYQNGTAHLYPVKSKKVKATHHTFIAYCLQNAKGEWLLRQHSERELLTGLWHYPMLEQEMIFESATQAELIEPLYNWLSQTLSHDIEIEDLKLLGYTPYRTYQPFAVKHIFSHRVWQVSVIPVQLKREIPASEGMQWLHPNQLATIPTSTLQHKLQAPFLVEEG